MTSREIRLIAWSGALVTIALFVVAGAIGYAYLKPAAAASGPIQASAVEAATTGTTIYEIDQTASTARYAIEEVLRGAPVTVVGETNQVAGQVALDLDDTTTLRLGTIQINARAFATDEAQRDRAVQNRVLLTDQHEHITFAPTEVVALPESLTVGKTSTAQVIGDLTIRDVTRPVTFQVSVTPLSADRLAGSAIATIRYADWGISIPSVPFVASVGEETRLDLTFEAMAL